jgi:hypothetical protein
MPSPESVQETHRPASAQVGTTAISRGDWIRTSDLPAPSRMRYQTAPRPGAGASLSQDSVRPRCEHLFVDYADGPGYRCSRCRQVKPASEFTMRGSSGGRPDTYCRPCRSEYGKEHYAANRQRYVDQAVARKRERRRARAEFLLEYFDTHPCTDCGESDPVVLEFDHVGDKNFNVGSGFVRYGWARLLAEIKACEVVCANCHRRRTYRRAGAWRVVLTELLDEGRAGDGSRTRAESLEGSSAAVTPHPRKARPSVDVARPRTDKGPGEPGPPPCL